MELKKYQMFSLMSILVLIIVSCTPATPAAAPTIAPTLIPAVTIERPRAHPRTDFRRPKSDVPRVSVEDAAAAVQSGEAIVVDVRSAQAYQQSHIPGAVSLPLFDIEQNPGGVNLEKDKWIITYCT